MLYWPCAKYTNGNGVDYDLVTYEGCDTLIGAIRQVRLWEDVYGFFLTEAHIDTYPPGGKVCVAVMNMQERTWEDVQ